MRSPGLAGASGPLQRGRATRSKPSSRTSARARRARRSSASTRAGPPRPERFRGSTSGAAGTPATDRLPSRVAARRCCALTRTPAPHWYLRPMTEPRYRDHPPPRGAATGRRGSARPVSGRPRRRRRSGAPRVPARCRASSRRRDARLLRGMESGRRAPHARPGRPRGTHRRLAPATQTRIAPGRAQPPQRGAHAALSPASG